MPRPWAILLTLALLLLAPLSAGAREPLVVDIDNHLVAITAGFTGTKLLVFGSVLGGDDVVVVVHGPKQSVVVRRKQRIAGIWVNRDSLSFEGVPAFYYVATTAEGGIDLPRSALRRHQIGVENIRMRVRGHEVNGAAATLFSEAVIRNKIKIGHYFPEPGIVERRGGRLFRTVVFVPANVPVGTYMIETLLIKNNQVVGAQTTPLFVNKEGFGARVFRAAHRHAVLYGAAAILIAAIAGLAANWIFHKL